MKIGLYLTTLVTAMSIGLASCATSNLDKKKEVKIMPDPFNQQRSINNLYGEIGELKLVDEEYKTKISDLEREIQNLKRERRNLEKKIIFVLAQGVSPKEDETLTYEDIYDVAYGIVWAKYGHAWRDEQGNITSHAIYILNTDQEIATVIKEIAGDDNKVTLAELLIATQRIPLE